MIQVSHKLSKQLLKFYMMKEVINNVLFIYVIVLVKMLNLEKILKV